MRWSGVMLAVVLLLAPLAFTTLGRQFTGEAKWLVGAGLLLAAVFAVVQRRAGAKVSSQKSGGAP